MGHFHMGITLQYKITATIITEYCKALLFREHFIFEIFPILYIFNSRIRDVSRQIKQDSSFGLNR